MNTIGHDDEQSGGGNVVDEEINAATDYEIAICVPDNEMRILFRNAMGVLSTHVMDASDAYAFAQKILQGYDKLEGIV